MASPIISEASTFLSTKRYAVVTGANRGLGLEICRQLASNGVIVVLTARDEKKGIESVNKLKVECSFCKDVVFHQLDVLDTASVATLAHFLKSQFGRLDILINNAAFGGVTVDKEALRAQAGRQANEINWKEVTYQDYEMATLCLETNYYGPKRVTEALVPLLQLSQSPRIVNVSSDAGKLLAIAVEIFESYPKMYGFFRSVNMLRLEWQNVLNEWAIKLLSDIDNLTEDRVEVVLNEFMKDFKEDSLETKSWPTYLSAYTISKASLNAYTRISAKKYPSFMINCVHPGFVKTNTHTGFLSIEQGAASPVRVALLPESGPSGTFFDQGEESSF